MLKSQRASIGFIFVTVLVDVIGLGIIIPVIPSLIEQLTGEGISVASQYGGWLIFSFAVMQFMFSPVLGELSDQYGRRPVLLIALLGLGIDYAFHAFAPTIGWLFLGRVLAGITGASFTVANAYIADVSTPEKRGQNFGIIGAAFGLGFIIGPVIGGFFSKWGVQTPFLVASGLTLLNFCYGFIVLPESLPKDKRRRFNWKRANPIGALSHLKQYPLVIGLIFAMFLSYISGHAMQSTWTYYTMFKFDWDEQMNGYSLGLAGLLVGLTQAVLMKYILKWLGDKKTVVISFTLWATGFFLFGIATEGWMMFAFLFPYCLGSVGTPAIQGIITNQVPDNEQGELQGAVTSMIGLTSIIGPLLMTNAFYFFTKEDALFSLPGAPFYLAAIFTGSGVLLAARAMKKVI